MAETWADAAAAEWLHWNELDYISGIGSGFLTPTPIDSGAGSANVKTGEKSFRLSGRIASYGLTNIDSSTCRAGFWMRWSGIADSSFLPITMWQQDSGVFRRCARVIGYRNYGWQFDVADSLDGSGFPVLSTIATDSAARFGVFRQDRWMHLSMEITPTTQKFWIDGQLLFDETDTFAATVNGVSFMASGGLSGFHLYAWMDDLWISSSSGANPPEAKGFNPAFPNADEGTNTWSALGGGDHYTEVDEDSAPDDDTSYVETTSDPTSELWDHAAVGLDSDKNFDIGAAYLIARSKIDNDGQSDYIPVAFYAKNGANTAQFGSPIPNDDIYGSYFNVRERRADVPGGSGWTEANFDATSFGVITETPQTH